jgi:hypothetical protein
MTDRIKPRNMNTPARIEVAVRQRRLGIVANQEDRGWLERQRKGEIVENRGKSERRREAREAKEATRKDKQEIQRRHGRRKANGTFLQYAFMTFWKGVVFLTLKNTSLPSGPRGSKGRGRERGEVGKQEARETRQALNVFRE